MATDADINLQMAEVRSHAIVNSRGIDCACIQSAFEGGANSMWIQLCVLRFQDSGSFSLVLSLTLLVAMQLGCSGRPSNLHVYIWSVLSVGAWLTT